MSVLTYTSFATKAGKPLAWLHGEIKTPPFSVAARIEAGLLLRAHPKIPARRVARQRD